MTSRIPALFIVRDGDLFAGGGGIPVSVSQFYDLLEAAGFDFRVVNLPYNKNAHRDLRSRLFASPYHNHFPSSVISATLEPSRDQKPRYIFLNTSMLRATVRDVRALFPAPCKIVFLSSALESVDYLHEIRMRELGSPLWIFAFRQFRLGRLLLDESRFNPSFDHVFCWSPLDCEAERWLGASAVTNLQPGLNPAPVDWQPVYGRFGHVGTMNHPPNMQGLDLFLPAFERIAPDNARVRLVGGPTEMGLDYARRFPHVEYLGMLTDEEIRSEAQTWNAFIHPLFVYSSGASFKLASALSWQIPLVTTTFGCRGYEWREGSLAIADEPDALARLALSLMDPETACLTQNEVIKVAHSVPVKEETVRRIRTALQLDGSGDNQAGSPRSSV